VLETSDVRKNVIESAKKLSKSNDELMKTVFIKKDTHPAIRKEYARLHKVEKEEKDKPENQGRAVYFEKETRSIKVDDVVIDKFGLISFF
jgi:hypothetical protein